MKLGAFLLLTLLKHHKAAKFKFNSWNYLLNYYNTSIYFKFSSNKIKNKAIIIIYLDIAKFINKELR
ncbi:MAG: hypothetical protein A2475_05565 [Ignavibacteria bacterium RIFOXYC2_FULL_35_21]|nr:MAG: hypothetical protein A2475_05565 [Ignavibacteria bacterium RIFOXYC2_FULL_35_21]